MMIGYIQRIDDVYVATAIIISIYIGLVIIRLTKIFKKKKCPVCTGRLHRKHRLLTDKMLIGLTLGILPFRRYKCPHCGWEGLRWSIKKQRQQEKKDVEDSTPKLEV